MSPHDDVDGSSRSHRSNSRSNTRYCGDRGASYYVGTMQDEQVRNALRSAPENKPWMPSVSELRQWYGYIAGSCRIPLFDSSRIHGLDSSAKCYRTEHDFTSMSLSDIDGTTATTTETKPRWRRRGIRLSATSRMLATILGWKNLMLLATRKNRRRIPVLGTN